MAFQKVTAGRDALGNFAPKFAEFNDDVLFDQVWNREEFSLRDRSLITVTALVSMGITDSSLEYHLETAKKNGIVELSRKAHPQVVGKSCEIGSVGSNRNDWYVTRNAARRLNKHTVLFSEPLRWP